MALGDEWQSIKRILTKSREAARGHLDDDELTEYINSLARVPIYGGTLGAIGGSLGGVEAGLYGEEELDQFRGPDSWEEPTDLGGLRPIATGTATGIAVGGATAYGTKKWAEYIRKQHEYNE